MKSHTTYWVFATVVIAGVAAKLRAALERRIPVGYQDQDGFHTGVATGNGASKVNWPPLW
jgi:hypothetical protein